MRGNRPFWSRACLSGNGVLRAPVARAVRARRPDLPYAAARSLPAVGCTTAGRAAVGRATAGHAAARKSRTVPVNASVSSASTMWPVSNSA